MSNIMNMKSIKNNAHRSGFDNSRRVCFTAKVGEYLPVHWMPVLPGDDIDINLSSFGRTAPLQTASMARVREYYDVYFVPYRLIWDKFTDWITQTEAPTMARSLLASVANFDTLPYFTGMDLKTVMDYYNTRKDLEGFSDDGDINVYYSTKKLLSYLGYSAYIGTNKALNPFPLLAYQKIYQDFGRFTQWEDTAPWTCNLDYIISNPQLHLNISSVVPNDVNVAYAKNLFRMQYCNYDKDYFLGLLPSAQFGDESIVSVIGPNSSLTATSVSGDLVLRQNVGSHDVATGYSALYLRDSDGTPSTYKSIVNQMVTNTELDPGEENVLSLGNFAQGAEFGILALRRAECLQKWKEITLSGDTDYVSQLEKHWNVSASKAMSNHCQYLGGTASNLDISEVLNTNLQSGGIADMGGKGILTNNGHIKFKNPNNDYGLLMVMYHTKPIIEWKGSTIQNRHLMDLHQTDFPIPEFDNIGMEQVFMYEFNEGWNNDESVAGYAPRYASYKTSYDICLGEFETSLQSWILPYTNRQISVLGPISLDYLSFKVCPSIADNLWAVNAKLADHFYNSLYLDIKSVRNLSRDGLPY